ncbi:MAG TPA: hypothetical protein VFO51_08260 [Sphingomicrobium sp.]|nr:hypothetical protein [Sphingomicrobium sp.]
MGSNAALRISSSLVGVESPANLSAADSIAQTGDPDRCSAELGQQVAEIAGNIFAQGFVIDRSERAPDLAGALFLLRRM